MLKLVEASKSGNLEEIEKLLEEGLDINRKDEVKDPSKPLFFLSFFLFV